MNHEDFTPQWIASPVVLYSFAALLLKQCR